MSTTSSEIFYPFFLNLKDKNILFVGGGEVAFNKIKRMLTFDPALAKNIKVISLEFLPTLKSFLEKNSIAFEKREFLEDDLDKVDFIIVATSDKELQKEIFLKTRNKRVFVNCVDFKEYSDFIFGSFIKEKDLIISIGTFGYSPALSKYLKRYIKSILPKNLGELLEELKKIRKNYPKGKKRMQILNDLVKNFFDKTQ